MSTVARRSGGGGSGVVDLSTVIAKSTLDPNTLLGATADDTPIAFPVAASRIVGRKASGDIDDLTPAEALAVLSGGGTPTGAKFLRDDNTLAVPINDRRWVRGSTAHAQDDEFNDSSLAGAWGRVDNPSGGLAKADWTEGGDSLSLRLNGNDASAELHGMVKPYALAVGESIQCHMLASGTASDYFHAGLIVSTNNVYGAGTQSYFNFFNSVSAGAVFQMSPSDWTSWSTRSAFATPNAGYQWGLSFHMRLTRSATSTWQFYQSVDGISWIKISADRTLTLSPAYVGFAGGTFGTNVGQSVFSFDYFRVT